jgi:uncharacterized protein YegJ (DUF2314 family)
MKCAVVIGLFAVVALAQAGDRIVDVKSDDREMNAAIVQAQASLDDFLAVLDEPPAFATGFTVKVRVAHRKGAEHLWIMPFRRDNSGFVGIVANEPDHLPDIHLGQEISFKRTEITDWGYEVNSKKKGFFTVCVMLKHMSADEVRQYQQDGFQC